MGDVPRRALAAAFAIARLPRETVIRDPQRGYRPQRIAIARNARPVYFASAAGGFAFFAITGLSGSLEPKFLAQLGIGSHLVAGSASASVFLAAALSQIVFMRLSVRTQVALGSALVALGAIAMTLGAGVPGWLRGFVTGAVIGGAGGGILLKGALGTAAGLAPAGRVGESTARIFVASFLGMGLPVVAVRVLTALGVDLTASMIGFSVVILVIVLASAITVARHRVAEVPGPR